MSTIKTIKCNKLHIHSKRLVDRIASVLLYEYNNYIQNKQIIKNN